MNSRTWATDPESVRAAAIASAGLPEEYGAEVTVDGEILTTFHDGVYTVDYDQRSQMTATVADGVEVPEYSELMHRR